MRSGSKTFVYVVGCELGLLKVGVADDPLRRLRNLQVGSPLPLRLVGRYWMVDRESAEAVAAAVRARFAARRERGDWFRADPLEVRSAISERSMIDLYRPSEAAERAASRAAAAAARTEAARAAVAANKTERRRRRQQRRLAAAKLLAAGRSQIATAEAVGVSDRTIRNWAKTKSFQTALRTAQAQAERQAARANAKAKSRRERNERRRFRRQSPGLWADLQARRPELRSSFQQQPIRPATPEPMPEQRADRRATPIPAPGLPTPTASQRRRDPYHAWLDQHDNRKPLGRADLDSRSDSKAAATVAAGGGIQAVIEATGLRTLENVERRIDPSILEQARQNDAAQQADDPLPPTADGALTPPPPSGRSYAPAGVPESWIALDSPAV